MEDQSQFVFRKSSSFNNDSVIAVETSRVFFFTWKLNIRKSCSKCISFVCQIISKIMWHGLFGFSFLFFFDFSPSSLSSCMEHHHCKAMDHLTIKAMTTVRWQNHTRQQILIRLNVFGVEMWIGIGFCVRICSDRDSVSTPYSIHLLADRRGGEDGIRKKNTYKLMQCQFFL